MKIEFLSVFLIVASLGACSSKSNSDVKSTPGPKSNPALVELKDSCLVTSMEKEGKDFKTIMSALMNDSAGGIKLGMTAEAAVKILGEPDSKTEAKEEAATGYMRSEWIWKTKGVSLDLDYGKKGKIVIHVTFKAPYSQKTSCGVGIGSSKSEVEKIYSKYRERDSGRTDSNTFGSVYGGIAFYYVNDKVTSFSMGAFAE
ncbi:hypothetical protein KKF34_11425 [Myxococcota bacterium]|nr:hypothetical protein [Myxococcota bacterium]MBU1381719.1 hypothetical protein [Myxococcota bacterium]MBU1497474.1 hypothetical protein [Myxococcota bacterium]